MVASSTPSVPSRTAPIHRPSAHRPPRTWAGLAATAALAAAFPAALFAVAYPTAAAALLVAVGAAGAVVRDRN